VSYLACYRPLSLANEQSVLYMLDGMRPVDVFARVAGLTINAKTGAYRCLRWLSSYISIPPVGSLRTQLEALTLPEEEWFGMYQNIPHSIQECILFSENGFARCSLSDYDFVRYSDLLRSEIVLESPNSKTQVQAVHVTLTDGRKMVLPVRGGNGRSQGSREPQRWAK
jgi:hypothetical protein